MFTIQQIKEAHAKVKSGADFPAYIRELIALGVAGYTTYVYDGHTDFSGTDNFRISSEARYAELIIAGNSDKKTFLHNLQIHQQGQTDYSTFSKQSAEAGIEKWSVDMGAMTCIYYNKAGDLILEERIPQ